MQELLKVFSVYEFKRDWYKIHVESDGQVQIHVKMDSLELATNNGHQRFS